MYLPNNSFIKLHFPLSKFLHSLTLNSSIFIRVKNLTFVLSTVKVNPQLVDHRCTLLMAGLVQVLTTYWIFLPIYIMLHHQQRKIFLTCQVSFILIENEMGSKTAPRSACLLSYILNTCYLFLLLFSCYSASQ